MSEAIDLQDARTAPGAGLAANSTSSRVTRCSNGGWPQLKTGRPAAERNINGLPMPFGWFALCYSDELAVGEVKPLHYFERELALWRGEDGMARLLDAYCPHLGAHMGYGGKVERQPPAMPPALLAVGTGTAAAVWQSPTRKPYPPSHEKARPANAAYPNVREANGFVWAWWAPPTASAPSYEVAEFRGGRPPGLDRLRKTRVDRARPHADSSRRTVPTAPISSTSTAVADYPDYDIRFDGHRRTAEVRVRMGHAPKGTGRRHHRLRRGRQPASPGRASRACARRLLVTGVTPVARDVTHSALRLHPAQGRPGRPETAAWRKAMIKRHLQAARPGRRWCGGPARNTSRQPPLCAGDGPINDFRNFFRQFYAGPEWEKYRETPPNERKGRISSDSRR